MTAGTVLAGVPLVHALPSGLESVPVLGLEYDSRRVQAGFLFFAFAGAKANGAAFAAQAVQKGAVAVLSEQPAPADFPAPWLQVTHGRRALATAARNFYQQPDKEVKLTGITGTNGKTTTSLIVDAMLRFTGAVTGLAGTIEYRVGSKVLPAPNTTPESLDVMRMIADVRKQGGTHFTMEVSSHALALDRVYGFRFHTAVFTNLTQDHLDFHGTMEEYFQAKFKLFDGSGPAVPRYAVVNADDPHASRFFNLGCPKLFYGVNSGNVRAVNVQSSFEGLRFTVEHLAGGPTEVRSPLLGTVNVYNLLAAFATGITYGLDPDQIAAGLAHATAVPGRFERVYEGQPFLVLVDYAHTDDALRNLIQAARALNPKRIITLFGCGGDRDRAKRPLMGKAAAELSDLVVLTSDNPRSEEPLAIIMDALVGVRRVDRPHLVEQDRAAAIRKAIEAAQPGDIVLLAGKGHETYQEIQGVKHPFDDREAARRTLRGFGHQEERLMRMSLAEIARVLQQPRPVEGEATGWSIDTRTLVAGDVFFALPGSKVDGHEYVPQALAAGAVACVVHRIEAEGLQFVVPDVEAALRTLGEHARSLYQGTVVGVTGSAGKTTTKDCIAALLSAEMAVGRTVGNLNNQLGVPLSLLRLPEWSRAAVLEMGMNHAGEIKVLAQIARPQIGVVTNVGYAHVENFENGIDGIAAAKRELIEGLPADGTAVLNADDQRVRGFRAVHPGRTITFGLDEQADIRATQVEYTPTGTRFTVDGVPFETAFLGRHGVTNVLAGLAVAHLFGIPFRRLTDAVRALHPGAMRGERLERNGVTIWNDCYNSNPDAVRVMLESLADQPAQRRIAVLGEMLELGRWAEPLHREVGNHVARNGFSVLVGIRGAARYLVEEAVRAGLDPSAACFFEDPAEAGRYLQTVTRPGDVILFKGSRGTRVERALEAYLG